MENNLIIISLGGSLIVPDQINTRFLKNFRELILKHIKKGKQFIIIAGGGRTARRYQKAARTITRLTASDIDWIGIHSTRLNAHLLRTIFRINAFPRIIKNPDEKLKFKQPVLIASGWKPGCSTDYDAVLLAKNFGAKTLINLTDINYVYDKDPRKFKDAKPIKEISWKEFRKIIPKKWNPGLSAPFDPVASKEAEKLTLKVIIAKGADLKNLDSVLYGKRFKGTIIS